MKNLILTAGIVLMGTVAMAQTTTTGTTTEQRSSVSTVARQTESGKGKGAVVSTEARKRHAAKQTRKENRTTLKTNNGTAQSTEVQATAETRKASRVTKADKVNTRASGATTTKPTRPTRVTKPTHPHPVKG